MRYSNICEGVFVNRPNRFIARVEINGIVETVHVKNTGRCKELLVPGCTVFLEKAANPQRKTAYDLVAVLKENNGSLTYINMDSLAPNQIAEEWLPKSGLFPKSTVFKREATHKTSRFDLLATSGDKRTYIEVKGVTLERDGVAYFPDAPTQRGCKHLRELKECAMEGTGAMVLFVVQMKGVSELRPNAETDPDFARALKEAHMAGVKVVAVDCIAGEGEVWADSFLPVII